VPWLKPGEKIGSTPSFSIILLLEGFFWKREKKNEKEKREKKEKSLSDFKFFYRVPQDNQLSLSLKFSLLSFFLSLLTRKKMVKLCMRQFHTINMVLVCIYFLDVLVLIVAKCYFQWLILFNFIANFYGEMYK
jgi:hypothetical protein